jgi:hypothetical protein
MPIGHGFDTSTRAVRRAHEGQADIVTIAGDRPMAHRRPIHPLALRVMHWLNAIAMVIVAVLVDLSIILMVTTMFPSLDVVVSSEVLGAVTVVALVVSGVGSLRHGPPVPHPDRAHRDRWSMPRLALLDPPVWSAGRKAGMWVLRGYIVLAVALVAFKTVSGGLGH